MSELGFFELLEPLLLWGQRTALRTDGGFFFPSSKTRPPMTGRFLFLFPEDQIYNWIFDGNTNRKLPEKKKKKNLKPSVN